MPAPAPTSVFDINPNNKKKTFTGTTTGTYAVAARLYEGDGAFFDIINADASYNMKYKIDVWPTAESTKSIPITAETTIAAIGSGNPTTNQACVRPFYCVELSVKNGTGACVYEIEGTKY